MLESLAGVIQKFGDNIKAVSVYQEALNLWEQVGGKDKLVAARIYRNILDISNSSTFFDDFQQFEDTYKSVISASIKLVDSPSANPETVYLLLAISRHFWVQVNPRNLERVDQYVNAAIELAKELDDPALQSAALGSQFFSYSAQGKHMEWLEICRQRLQLSQHPKFDDPREMIDILHRMSLALIIIGKFTEALDFIAQTHKHTELIQDLFNQVQSMTLETFVWFRLDRWDDVINVYEKWRMLEQRYPNFMKRAGPLCFQIGLTASVFTLRGEGDKGAALRDESFAIMSTWSGPPENWGGGNYY